MITYYPFIEYLRNRMIFDMPSADELKSLLDKKVLEVKTHEERLELLEAVERLWNSREIDIYYKGETMDFIYYVQYKIREEKTNKGPQKKWEELFNELLNQYITDVSLSDFNDVMNYNRLPNGKDKVKWMTIKSEAVYFQKEMNFTMKQFNECFIHKDGTKFAENNRLETDPDQTLIDILTRHK